MRDLLRDPSIFIAARTAKRINAEKRRLIIVPLYHILFVKAFNSKQKRTVLCRPGFGFFAVKLLA